MFILAERLGMTVAEVGSRMSARELILWVAHDSLTAQETEMAQAKHNSRR
jgi:hypothetical protein